MIDPMAGRDKSYVLIFRKDISPFVRTTRWILIILKVLLILVLLLFRIPYYQLLALILAAASILEIRALKLVPSVHFSAAAIVFNGIIKKTYPWTEVENVILKDGLLTVDFKNNRLFQKETDGKTDEQEFNDWCRKNYTN